ncbi:hypothetical protein [Rhizobium leguminosarum]
MTSSDNRDSPPLASTKDPLPSGNIRARATFVPHVRVPWTDGTAAIVEPDNMIWRASRPEENWIEDSTAKIGEWRALVRNVYLRWALTINASAKAEERYRALPSDQALTTSSLRVVDGAPRQVEIARWPGAQAAEHYAAITPLIAAYGVADLYGALEDIIFDFYEIVLRQNPDSLLRGDEYRPLRRLRAQRGASPEAEKAWRKAWDLRFTTWRRKRAYDGLPDVLVALYRHAGLQRPSQYSRTDVVDWARSLEMIGELRHHVVHGAAIVSDKLGALSNTANSLTFDFVTGAALDVRLHHLQSVECFSDQLLTAFNISLMEKVLGPFREIARRSDDRKGQRNE